MQGILYIIPFTSNEIETIQLIFLLEKGKCALMHSPTNIQSRLAIIRHQKKLLESKYVK